MENERIEIEVTEYRELLDLATRVGIMRRIVKDEDIESSKKGYSRSIDTALIRRVLGMTPFEITQEDNA